MGDVTRPTVSNSTEYARFLLGLLRASGVGSSDNILYTVGELNQFILIPCLLWRSGKASIRPLTDGKGNSSGRCSTVSSVKFTGICHVYAVRQCSYVVACLEIVLAPCVHRWLFRTCFLAAYGLSVEKEVFGEGPRISSNFLHRYFTCWFYDFDI